MLRISCVDDRQEHRLVLEGRLISPWTGEVRNACEDAMQRLGPRQLVIELRNLTEISEQGEDLLAALMSEGVRFRFRGVFAKQVLRQVTRRPEARPVLDGKSRPNGAHT